jgi:hypothetical protein
VYTDINQITKERKQVARNGIQPARNEAIQIILFANDETIIAKYEDVLHIATYQLN